MTTVTIDVTQADRGQGDLAPFSFQVDVADRYLTAPAVTP